ncbi:MAG: peptide ABC transporter substrate-binding protein [Spirochaetes bacterium]|nr:peptide ABC transporter substrate-binding protein [Spirochaetota bacterium]
MKKSLLVILVLAAAFSLGAQEFIIANGAEPASLDPSLMTDTTSSNINLALNEGLMVYDPRTSKGIPGLAESYTTSPDGKVVTFKIRKAFWSDGTPVKAQDFVYGWLRTLAPDTASDYAYMLGMVVKGADAYNAGKGKAEDVGVKALNDQTFEVTLVGPAAYFVDMTCHQAFNPLPKWTIEQYGNQWTKPGNYVGTGPYNLKEWKPQDYILVEKNPKYWDAKNVKIKSIKYLASDNSTTNYKMYKAGAVDWQSGITLDLIDEIVLRKDYQVSARFGTYYLSFNDSMAPFNNVNVRKAFSAAIDKKTLVDKVLKGGQIPTDQFCPPMAGYTPQKGVGFDPAAAKKYLAAAGYPDGKGFPPLTYVYNTNEGHKKIAEYLQQQLKINLGIDITLQNMEWNSFLSMRAKHDYLFARHGWIGDYLDPNTMLDLFVTGGGNNDERCPGQG